jgi:transposase
MASIPYRAGKWFARRRATRRAVPLMWAFAVAEALGATRRHFSGVDPRVRRRAVELARKSKGRPSNLTAHEKKELRRLVGEMDLWQLSKELAAVASPVGMPGRRKKHG